MSRPSHPPADDGHHAIAAAALMATYMQAVNISIPNAALPHIQATLSMANDEVGWVFSSYIAASAVTMSITQWLAGRYGRKPVYQVPSRSSRLAWCSIRWRPRPSSSCWPGSSRARRAARLRRFRWRSCSR